MITIKLDSENYTTEYAEETIVTDLQEVRIEKHFSEDDLLLYFLVLMNENHEITQMGFLG